MNVDVSVVICAHDNSRWRPLQAAVRSLEDQHHPPAEIVLVIDHNPLLFERARKHFTQATVVENSGPPGLGGARNSGIDVASGSVVAFLDDDAIASGDWLGLLVERYSEPDVAGVGGSVEPVWSEGRPRWFPSEFDWVVGCTYRGMPTVAQEVRNLMGCNMSLRRELLNRLGRFRLGYGCDETELCIRLRQRWPETKLLYVPEARVFHQVSPTRARLPYLVSRCYFEGGSKAVVSSLVGTEHGLSSEVRYTREVLPSGVRRGVGEFVRRRDLNGLARAAAIVAGLTSTTAGYLTGRMSTARAARRRGWCGGVFPRSGST
ncbi:MAG: glycosyltransferase [Actinomycetota bacterium]|nr:glycosyltransferase [Actinomycetota bacterium]